ncbi:polyketide synthase [Aspergillus ellipticus CBS 707.79]|uniref:Polyketide synthase n=1 Tax=Aspergillus ellipticus CBS 707.79 TaxID=1448320 RepID=A0A319D0S4_9EURO|nr:polyketide synthase [Aspergillus ellipticus CBS 707.79]
MNTPKSPKASDIKLLLFGPQALSFNVDSLCQLRSILHHSPGLFQWALDVLAELPALWDDLVTAIPNLRDLPDVAQRLKELSEWFQSSNQEVPRVAFPLQNVLLTPLVVLTQLAQYAVFVQAVEGEGSSLGEDVQTVGLCTGLLSALAVSAGRTREELGTWGKVAVRLAVVVGAVVDLDDLKEEAQSLAVSWGVKDSMDVVGGVLEGAKGYVSVVYDERRATITTTKSSASDLFQKFKAAGLVGGDVSLRGSFHSSRHEQTVKLLEDVCASRAHLQFPVASKLAHPAVLPAGSAQTDARLDVLALRAILVDKSQWHCTFSAAQSDTLQTKESQIASFGPERCVPPSLLPKIGSRIIHVADLDLYHLRPTHGLVTPPSSTEDDDDPTDCRIAVVGMSCQVPGARDLEQFSALLREGKSQHIEVPSSRFGMDTPWRTSDPKRKWYGNFIDDHDSFDHKFFKKSPREMASMDPQHRLILQTAYQALEQSGYFHDRRFPDKHIGCFLGVGLVDYENNIACHPATAYAATGNLKSFAAGRISHHFGWTGPSLTLDTACSSSAVAVHQACRAILHNECSAALAGASSLMTSPDWFHNLAGASFLSPTGQCKPFDALADGYCRGEAVGAVFLKKYSAAVADNDQILGVIAATEVFQNQNCTAITVPNSISLGDLFNTVTKQARLGPSQVTVVEAHGTGTPVGDPAEYDSVRNVFACSPRSMPVSLGSVKGLVGHGESASGMTALIKVLLMAHEAFIPPQPSFTALNPSIDASKQVEIATALKPWLADLRAALINNYGASGSNASMIVTQNPAQEKPHTQSQPSGVKLPFWLCGLDQSSLRRYASRLREFIANKGNELSLSNLSFQLARQSNRTLEHTAIFSCSTLDEFDDRLFRIEQGSPGTPAIPRKAARPVILCFGGQVSTFVGLDRTTYESTAILRHHLDHCNAVCVELGLDSIYPTIFQRSPIESIVQLQTSLFAIQYSCARSWIDCGLSNHIVAVVGHSFGELTALCVSGGLALPDALRMISGRAQLIQSKWGEDQGLMMAVEADLDVVQQLLGETNQAVPDALPVNIACFNASRSFTLAGSTQAIDQMAAKIKEAPFSGSVRGKKLNVTNAFHSALVDPLVPGLAELGQSLPFQVPNLRWEQAAETKSSSQPLTVSYVADHMRNPVHFVSAVQRLAQDYPSAIWLEAGSNSTITTLASRALGSASSQHHFQSINITHDGACQSLSEATTALWKEGVDVSFWPHHASQTTQYPLILLPPYQFEYARHWLDRTTPEPTVIVSGPPQTDEPPSQMWTFIGYQDQAQRAARFRINTNCPEYQGMLSGHLVVQTSPICSSVLQLEITMDALSSLRPQFKDGTFQPQLQAIDSHGPMNPDSTTGQVWLDFTALDDQALLWKFAIGNDDGRTTSPFASGRIAFSPADDEKTRTEFARYERLVHSSRCQSLISSLNVDEAMQGHSIYKAFAEIVDYSAAYKGLHKIVSKGMESAGQVVRRYPGKRYVDTGLLDSFCQVAGIFINCMMEKADADMYISDRIEQWMRAPRLHKMDANAWPEAFDVYAANQRINEKEILSDVLIFDAKDGTLVEVVLGIHYQRLPKDMMRKVLERLGRKTKGSTPNKVQEVPTSSPPPVAAAPAPLPAASAPPVNVKPKPDIQDKVRALLCDLSGLEPEDIKPETGLGDMGIDSLMGMEVAREIESAFTCTLDVSELENLTDFTSLLRCIENALGYSAGNEPEPAAAIAPQVNGASAVNVSHINGDSNGVKVNGNFAGTATAVREAFATTKQSTDEFIERYGLAGYSKNILPTSTELVIVHILDAFDTLGASIRQVEPGQTVSRIPYLPRHERFVDFIYGMLENQARLVRVEGTRITRTSTPCPDKSASVLMEELLAEGSDHSYDHRLTYMTGSRLADCLSGAVDGVQLLFGSAEGREQANGMYSQSPINLPWIKQMEFLLEQFFVHLPAGSGTINILEMGAGTGGTTSIMAPLLARMRADVVYTVTDISASLVAGLRKRFKQFPFMRFKTFNIEESPAADLLQSQHIVLATNCIHATQDLVRSTTNVHQVLRPDGVLMMLEMTDLLPWVDLVFGPIEGWWLFNDSRQHALASPEVWERTLHQVGYGWVDWTEGHRPEASIQRVIVAMASGSRYDRVPLPAQPVPADSSRQATIDAYVSEYVAGFQLPSSTSPRRDVGTGILVTGATGSLGSHLVAHLSQLHTVQTVICLNRPRSTDAKQRQEEALQTRGIEVDATSLAKIHVFQADASKPQLGLAQQEFNFLVDHVTDIIHNAWPMSISRSVDAFESQFQVLRNLLDLAAIVAQQRPLTHRIGFQFISSIATVGQYPRRTGRPLIPENRMTAESALSTGYSEAKLVCEHMLDRTLHQHLSRFRPMVVRIGQIAGSKTIGHWNPVEHLAFMLKSSQTLKALPVLEGDLSWCLVNDVAGTLGDLILGETDPYPVYHIENPRRQPWHDMLQLLADVLEAPDLVPFSEWTRRVRSFPGPIQDNPAARLVDFLDEHFIAMSCHTRLVLNTAHSRQHSPTLARAQPVDPELVRRYVQRWKEMGFLR